jgi:hypothetical protein
MPEPSSSRVTPQPARGETRRLLILSLIVSHLLAFAVGYAAYSFSTDATVAAESRGSPRPRKATAQATAGWVIPLGEGGDGTDWLVPLERVLGREQNMWGDLPPMVVYTWANHAMRDFVANFVLHMRLHNITTYVIGSMDQQLTQYLHDLAREARFDIPVLNLHAGLTTGDFGWNSQAFKQMAKSKFQSVQQMQSRGYDVVVVDSDVAWLRNPLPFFKERVAPDMLVSTDALRRMPLDEQLHTTLNIGIMLFRARPAAIDFVTRFYNDLVSDPNFGTDKAEWDQARFGRMAHEWSSRVRIEALDVLDFCNGHVFYTQKLPQKLNHTPYMVHQTFQFAGTAGKRHRFREAMLWLADDDVWYDPAGGLLVYDHVADPALFQPRDVNGHFALMNPQLAQFRTAWALARALNRTLVMPSLLCGMDRVWFAHDGRFPGSDELFTLPFHCPADHVFDLESWQRLGVLDQLREYSLLDNPRTPENVRTEHVTVAFDYTPGASVHVPRGVTAQALRDMLKTHATARVLRFGRIMPDVFSDWDDGFEDVLRQSSSIWCCTPGHNPGHIHYDLLYDKPHVDRHGRRYETWQVKYGP